MLQRFVPRKVSMRGQKFLFELGNDMKLPLQFYKKVQPADLKLTMEKYALKADVQVVFFCSFTTQTFCVGRAVCPVVHFYISSFFKVITDVIYIFEIITEHIFS